MTAASSTFDLLRGLRRVVFVHAHPDDETLAGGALVAWLTAHGVEVDVITATRGERGEIVEGVEGAHVGSSLVARRAAELRGALDVLGVSRRAYLGTPPARTVGLAPRVYTDSGMRWISDGLAGPADDADPDSLTAADRDEAAADVAAFLALAGGPPADLVMSYDVLGGYGHPDHVAAHHITRRAAALAGVQSAELVSGPPPAAGVDQAGVDRPGERWLDLADQLPTVQRALRCHATQVRVDGADVVHSGGQRQPIATTVGIRFERGGAAG